MQWRTSAGRAVAALLASVAGIAAPAVPKSTPRSLRGDVGVALVATTPGPSQPVRLARDPRNDAR